jgi:hypothetical protein
MKLSQSLTRALFASVLISAAPVSMSADAATNAGSYTQAAPFDMSDTPPSAPAEASLKTDQTKSQTQDQQPMTPQSGSKQSEKQPQNTAAPAPPQTIVVTPPQNNVITPPQNNVIIPPVQTPAAPIGVTTEKNTVTRIERYTDDRNDPNDREANNQVLLLGMFGILAVFLVAVLAVVAVRRQAVTKDETHS